MKFPDRIPGTLAAAQACLASRGGSITNALDAIAWTYLAHQVGPWTSTAYRSTRDSVRDYAAHIYDMLDGYRSDASFDDLKDEHHDEFLRSVAASFHEVGNLPADPITLADHLLTGLRMARELVDQHGTLFRSAADSTQSALFALLLTQSIEPKLALESIGYALETGVSVHEAVAYMDGQL
ncbi:hypothetical protein [Nonomuraea ceibae]|uniref:hypothetical protein n=1 Tax=Nonomuraea ceibae TaxID=1935170 RepID=UPI001C5DB631|nr:hypothetical protein [Nonomuraea ceibae]